MRSTDRPRSLASSPLGVALTWVGPSPLALVTISSSGPPLALIRRTRVAIREQASATRMVSTSARGTQFFVTHSANAFSDETPTRLRSLLRDREQ